MECWDWGGEGDPSQAVGTQVVSSRKSARWKCRRSGQSFRHYWTEVHRLCWKLASTLLGKQGFHEVEDSFGQVRQEGEHTSVHIFCEAQNLKASSLFSGELSNSNISHLLKKLVALHSHLSVISV